VRSPWRVGWYEGPRHRAAGALLPSGHALHSLQERVEELDGDGRVVGSKDPTRTINALVAQVDDPGAEVLGLGMRGAIMPSCRHTTSTTASAIWQAG